MDANHEPTLDSTLAVLDPALHDHPPAEAEPDADTPDTPARKARKPRASDGAADAKRREANRLAAERSRGRQQEKVIALELAVQALSEENLRLKDEIAKLESGELETLQEAMSPAQPPAPVPAPQPAPVSQQEDDSQKYILNALLNASNTAPLDDHFLDPIGELDPSWMQNLLQEVDASGRLGELAAVAAGQEGQAAPVVVEDAIDKKLAGGLRNTNAAALNAEMEKSLREDVSKTRSAIGLVERQLARMRGEHVEDDDEPVSLTFEGAFPRTADEMRARIDETQAEIDKLTSEASVLREVLVRMRDVRAEDAAALATASAELRGMELDGGEREHEQISGVLRALRGQISAMMAHPSGSFELMTPFASPATARRRRGRPPKHASSSSLRYGQVYSPTRSESEPDSPSVARPARASRARSRLANELRLSPAAAEAGPSDIATNAQEHANAHDDYLLSHLTDAADARQNIPLDSSSFAAFLPASPGSSHSPHPHSHPHSHANSHPPGHGQLELDQPLDGVGIGVSLPQTPNVLSRFKRGPPGSCDICARTQTSVWRKLNYEGEDLRVCNACGLYYTKFGVPRPPELWGDGRTIKKRKASARASGGAERGRKRKSIKYEAEGHGLDTDGHGEGEGEEEQTQGYDASVAAAAAVAAVMQGQAGANGETLNDVGRAVEDMFGSVGGAMELGGP